MKGGYLRMLLVYSKAVENMNMDLMVVSWGSVYSGSLDKLCGVF